jgi:hypothetical protein
VKREQPGPSVRPPLLARCFDAASYAVEATNCGEMAHPALITGMNVSSLPAFARPYLRRSESVGAVGIKRTTSALGAADVLVRGLSWTDGTS